MDNCWDLIIIGGGPAGLAAGQYGARANLKTLILEKQSLGGQTLLIDNLENYPAVVQEKIAGYDFIDNMVAQAKKFGAKIEYHDVIKITKDNNKFQIITPKKIFIANSVVVATGAKHRHLDIQGEDKLYGKGVSYCATCDGPFFKDKKIVVVGGGDSACDEAMFLSKLTESVTMIHRKDRFRAQKAVADKVLLNDKIEKIFNTVVTSINGENSVASISVKNILTGEEKNIVCDAVFIFVGTIPVTDFLPDNIDKDSAQYIRTDENMQTNIKGLFCAGDVRATPFRQIVTACSDGAIAAHKASEYLDELNNNRYI